LAKGEEEEGAAPAGRLLEMDSFSVVLLLMLAWLGLLIAARPQVHRMRHRCREAPRGTIARPEQLEERSQPIGRYAGREIYASVKFMGRRYHFAGVAPAAARVEERELLVEPGLMYRDADC
jgi:hypothetical protein